MEEAIPQEQAYATVAEVVADQLDLLLAMLHRPAVQRQLLVILAILLVAVLAQEIARRRRARSRLDLTPGLMTQLAWRERFIALLLPLVSPITALLLTFVALWYFGQRGFPSGMLENVVDLFLIWFGFRLFLALLYAKYGDAVRPFHRRVFLPLLVMLIIVLLLDNSLIIDVLFDIPVLKFSGVETSLGDFIIAILTLYAFAVASWILELALNHVLPKRLDAEPGVVRSVATLVRYAVLGLGILVSLSVMGFNATSVAIVAGGLSVGIGIGMQDIVGNFVSGLTLLFEQSLRPGDIIELDGRINEVEKISLRSTIVRTLDNTELIIPNATFTTSQVNNLTRDGRLVRIRIPFGVAYGSDQGQVSQVAVETALGHELSLSNPPPRLLHKGFGDSALLFELTVWMRQPQQREIYKSDLYYQLLSAFEENQIKIPFPQRDIHFPSGTSAAFIESLPD